MADEAQQVPIETAATEISAGAPSVDPGKRKFEDSAAAEPAAEMQRAEQGGEYSNVPPVSDFDIAKQKAADLAAKFSADGEAKRLKTENGQQEQEQGTEADIGALNSQETASAIDGQAGGESQLSSQAAGFQGYEGQEPGSSTKKIDVPNSKVGLVIGKQGETIKYLQQQSGARIQVTRDADTDPRSQHRAVELMGDAEQIKLAEKLINDVITEQAGVGGSGALLARGFGGLAPPGDSVAIKVPNNKVGLIIGRGGETIKNLQNRSGARIQVQSDRETEPGATERVVTLIGNKRSTDMASELIAEVVDDDRPRGAPVFGGGSGGGRGGGYGGGAAGAGGGGYRQSQWGPQGGAPPQQGGYGGYQQAPYQGPPQQQYGAPPQQYGGYPQQQAGFQTGWDQRSAAPAQPVQQQSGYGYYGQQTQPAAAAAPAAAAPADSSYAYAQQGQGYYGYQQQQPAATDASYQQAGYAQQQQGYAQPAYAGQQATQQTAQGAAAYNGYSYPQQAAAGGDQTAYAQQGYAQQGYTQAGYAQPAADGSAAAGTYDYSATATTGAATGATGQA